MSFLAEAFGPENGFEIRVRPHPEFRLEAAERLIQGTPRVWYHVSFGSLAEDLGWADVVLYASSTVGMEAVGLGVPAIYLDLGQVLNTDPLSNRNGGLSWTVGTQTELRMRLRMIEEIPLEEFLERQRSDSTYVGDYLVPPTGQRIQTLMEVR